MTYLRPVMVLGVMLAGVALTSPTEAQIRGDRNRGNGGAAYDNGYRDGVDRGERRVRSNRASSYRSERNYRQGDRGYSRRDGDRTRYKQRYRAGFATGYAEGYGSRGAYRDDRNPWNNRGSRGVRRGGRDGRGYQGYQGYGRGVRRAGFDRGLADGLDKGLEDARDGDRYNPARHRRYRRADRGYRARFGSRDRYRDAYRTGFLAGYERGYRDGAQRRGNRRDRGIRWPF